MKAILLFQIVKNQKVPRSHVQKVQGGGREASSQPDPAQGKPEHQLLAFVEQVASGPPYLSTRLRRHTQLRQLPRIRPSIGPDSVWISPVSWRMKPWPSAGHSTPTCSNLVQEVLPLEYRARSVADRARAVLIVRSTRAQVKDQTTTELHIGDFGKFARLCEAEESVA